MASALSVPLSFVIIPLSRDLKELKKMDKKCKMFHLWKQSHEIPMHEYGLARNYLVRKYLDETDAS